MGHPKNSPEAHLVEKWNKRFSSAVDMRMPFERQWYMNIAFYFSRQWIYWDDSKATLNKFTLKDLPRRHAWEIRTTANKIQPIIRNELTKLCKEVGQYYVNPSTTEQSDIAGARAANLIAEYILDTCNYNKKKRQAVFWALMTGTSFQKTIMNGVGLDQDQWKIVYEALSSYFMYLPNLLEEDLEMQPWICHARAVDPEVVYTTFGTETKPDSEVKAGDFLQRLQSLVGIHNTGSIQQNFLKEFWLKPCRDFPEGVMFIISGDQLIYMSAEDGSALPDAEPDPAGNKRFNFATAKTPYDHKMFPFAKIDHIPSGRAYGMSVIEGLISLQKDYNKARSQIRESANRTSAAQWTVQKGAVNVRKITNEPGLVIEFQPGFEPPKPVQSPELPQYTILDPDKILKDMDDFSGQYEVAHGRTPPGVEAASAIAYLQEENDTRLFHTSASIEEATQVVGFQTLSLIQQFWSPDRTIKVTSKNNIEDVRQFKTSDINENTDFRVEPGSMAPKSRAARQAFILEMFNNGAIDKEQMLRYLQMVETNRMFDEIQLDRRHAERENFRMERGEPVQINSYDNDMAHIIAHQNWMKTSEYEILDEQIKIVCEQHVQAHKERLAFSQGAIQQQEGNTNAGAPGEPSSNGTEPASSASV